MFSSPETEQIPLPETSSSPMGSNPDSLDGLPPVPVLPDSPPLSTIFCDVNVVPEQEKNELEQSIVKLEGKFLVFFLLIMLSRIED